tara:strand:+ start:718 stop:1017 length:300 start_codon:yes stop_codon:yes gene_type:complete
MPNYKRDSFLAKAEYRDRQFMDVNRVPTIGKSIDDENFTITPEYEERPDKLAHVLYESSRLWWVFAARNPDILKDPLGDFTAGTTIKIPAMSSIRNIVG